MGLPRATCPRLARCHNPMADAVGAGPIGHPLTDRDVRQGAQWPLASRPERTLGLSRG